MEAPKKSRQIRRAERRTAAKKQPDYQELKNQLIKAVTLLQQEQLHLSTIYRLLLEKKVFTTEEFQKKQLQIVQEMTTKPQLQATPIKEAQNA